MDRCCIALIIPAYNEAQTITCVVKSALLYGQPIVVDDCSSDATAELAKQAGAIVVPHEANKGYDATLNSGFVEAVARGYEVIVTLDADGQHSPLSIPMFINKINKGASIVFGVRMSRPRIAENLFAWYTSYRYGVKDPLCGMKGYRCEVYKELGYFDSYRSIGTELALYGVKKGFTFDQVSIEIKERLDEPRFGRLARANFLIFRAMMIDLFR